MDISDNMVQNSAVVIDVITRFIDLLSFFYYYPQWPGEIQYIFHCYYPQNKPGLQEPAYHHHHSFKANRFFHPLPFLLSPGRHAPWIKFGLNRCYASCVVTQNDSAHMADS